MEIKTADTIHRYSIIPHASKTVLLMGNNSTGRTTFAQLVKKHVWGQQNPDLKFDNGKYILDNVIAVKSIRAQTIYPQYYEGPEKNSPIIVDVPCNCFSPQTKKWTSLDQRVVLNCMSDRRQGKVTLALFGDEKITRTNVNPWKKALASFMEIFNNETLEDDFFNSVVFVISKAGPEITHEVMLKRLQKLAESIDKEDSVTQRLLERVMANNSLLIFHKVTGDEVEGQEMRKNWGKLSEMCQFPLSRKHLKDMGWTQQEKDILEKQVWVEFQKATKEIFEQFEQALQNVILDPRPLPVENSENFKASQQVIMLFEEVQVVDTVMRLIQIKEMTEQKQIEGRQLLIKILTSGVFANQQDTWNTTQYVIERMDFKENGNFDWPWKSVDVKVQNLPHWLIKSEGPPQDLQECQKIIEAMEKLKATMDKFPAECQKFVEECKMSLARLQDPKKALEFIQSALQKEKNAAKQVEHVLSAAGFLKKQGLTSQSFQLFEMCKSVGDVIDCDLQAEWVSQDIGLKWVNLMKESCMFAEAKRGCQIMAAKGGMGTRKKWGEEFGRVMAAQKEYFSGNMNTNVLLEEPNLGEHLALAQEIIQNSAKDLPEK